MRHGSWVASTAAEPHAHARRIPEANAIREAALATYQIPGPTFSSGPLGQPQGAAIPTGTVPDPPGAGLPSGRARQRPSSPSPACCAVFDAARRMLAAYHRQQEARSTLNSIESRCIMAKYDPETSGTQARSANRARRKAQEAYDEAWHAYQAAGQGLCRVMEQMIEFEGREDDALT